MSSLLWLNLLITLPCFILSAVCADSIRWALFGVGLLVIIFTLFEFHGFKKTNPRLLQSESYQIEMEKLDLIGEMGGSIDIEPVEIALGRDPARLDSPEENPEVSHE